ncbi:MAG: hypothetical protein Kow0037_23040 [Calditrichia bacterium]
MSTYRPGIDPDRRKGPDLLTKSIRWFTVIGWIIMITVLLFIGFAKPEDVTFFDRWFGVQRRTSINLFLVRLIFVLLILGMTTSLVGLYVNFRRSRRKDDEYRVSFFILGMLSILGIIVYSILF